jgi:hypothetical protein
VVARSTLSACALPIETSVASFTAPINVRALREECGDQFQNGAGGGLPGQYDGNNHLYVADSTLTMLPW